MALQAPQAHFPSYLQLLGHSCMKRFVETAGNRGRHFHQSSISSTTAATRPNWEPLLPRAAQLHFGSHNVMGRKPPSILPPRLARGHKQSTESTTNAVSQHGAVDAALKASYKKLEDAKSSILFTLADGPGSLQRVLALFQSHGVNMTAINSKPSKGHLRGTFEFQVDFDGAPGDPAVSHRFLRALFNCFPCCACADSPPTRLLPQVDALLTALRSACVTVSLKDAPLVPWFPTRIADIDTFSTKTLDAGTELEADHPGFSDIVYRERRRRIVEAASTYRCGDQIPRVEYSPEEVSTWGNVYRKLRSYTQQYAIEQYNAILPLLEQVGNAR